MNLDIGQCTAHPADAYLLARRHILAIDDDPMNRGLVAEYLGQNDLRITAVPDGPAMQSALEGDVVDLVLLDLKRKTGDGMTLLKRLRDLSAVPLIILTDRAEEADKVMGLEMGADDYITRPFGLREISALSSVMRYLARGLGPRHRVPLQRHGVHAPALGAPGDPAVGSMRSRRNTKMDRP